MANTEDYEMDDAASYSDDSGEGDVEALERRRKELLEMLGGDDVNDENNEEGKAGRGDWESQEGDSEGDEEDDSNEGNWRDYSLTPDDAERHCPAKRLRTVENGNGNCVSSEVGLDEDARTESRCPMEQGTAEGTLKKLKRVPEFRGTEGLGELPEGWIETLHESGLPVYLYKPTRVIALSRPYKLGPDSVRRHSIPLASIPCEQQRRIRSERERLAKEKESRGVISNLPLAQIKTVDQIRDQRLPSDEVYQLIKKEFGIKEIWVNKFKAWRIQREERRKEEEKRTIDPLHTIHLKNAVISVDANQVGSSRRGLVLNTVGKTSVTMLHEYVQKVVKGSLSYEYTEVRSSLKPYHCVCTLKLLERKKNENGEGHDTDAEEVVTKEQAIGRGRGESKKNAKCEAATIGLKVLIPGLKIDERHIVRGEGSEKETVDIFDLLGVEDEKVTEMSLRAGQPLPYHLLQECLRRNIAWGDTQINESAVKLAHQKYEMTLRVAKHEATLICRNKKEGRQRCSQKLLKMLHPVLTNCTWGSLLRLYGSSSNEAHMEAVKARNEVVKMTPNGVKSAGYVPNAAVLNHLRNEMSRVARMEGMRKRREIGLLGSRRGMEGDEMECPLCCLISDRRRHIEHLWRRRLLVTADERRARRRFVRLMRGFDAEDVDVLRRAIESEGRDARQIVTQGDCIGWNVSVECAPGPPMDEKEEEMNGEDSGLIPQIDRPMSMPYLCCKLWRWRELQVDAALHSLDSLPWCRFGRVTINNATVSCCNPYHYALWIRAENSDEKTRANGHLAVNNMMTVKEDEIISENEVPATPPPPPPPLDDSSHSPLSSPSRPPSIHPPPTVWGRLQRWERREKVAESVALSGAFAAVGLLANTVHDAQPVTNDWDQRNDVSFSLIRQTTEDVWLYNSGNRSLFVSVISSSKADALRRLSPGYCVRVYRARIEGSSPRKGNDYVIISVGAGWGSGYDRDCAQDTRVRYEVNFPS